MTVPPSRGISADSELVRCRLEAELDALEGGVNASLNLDFHGKSFSYLLLGMTVEVGR